MRKAAFIATGIVAGIVAQIVALYWVYAGTNLFHGGHPHAIAAVLLPGASIVDHVSNHAPPVLPAILLLLSLVQFPIYGALGGRDYAEKRISQVTKAVLVLHLVASLVASYGLYLEMQWQKATEAYGACLRANVAAENLALSRARIVSLVRGIEQSKREIGRLRAEKDRGAVLMPDPEEAQVRNLADQEGELEQQWNLYKESGGTATSPGEVSAVASPCGTAPRRPEIF